MPHSSTAGTRPGPAYLFTGEAQPGGLIQADFQEPCWRAHLCTYRPKMRRWGSTREQMESTSFQLAFWQVNLHRSLLCTVPLMALGTVFSFLCTRVPSPSSAGTWPYRHMTHTSGFLMCLWDIKKCQLHYKRTSLLHIKIELLFHCHFCGGKIIFILFFHDHRSNRVYWKIAEYSKMYEEGN